MIWRRRVCLWMMLSKGSWRLFVGLDALYRWKLETFSFGFLEFGYEVRDRSCLKKS